MHCACRTRSPTILILLHMLFLDGIYIDGTNGLPARFLWVKALTSEELTQLLHTIV